jgi:hypothetical protein
MRPWSAEHAAGKITRPLRHNGIPYKGITLRAATRRAIEDLRRSRGSGLGPTTMQTFDGFGPDGRPTAQSLIAPGASTLGTDSHPLVVHVQNQVTGEDIARGTTSYQASKLNRPPSGFTGSDTRIDPLGAFYGMVTSPY